MEREIFLLRCARRVLRARAHPRVLLYGTMFFVSSAFSGASGLYFLVDEIGVQARGSAVFGEF